MVRRAFKSRKGDSGVGGRGRRTKEGVYGIAAAYMTRNQALKKLQISLKDFRRLCILKGIFPRDPKKKKQGTDKTYYHHKDILYLSHEPLLDKFRQLKIALRKYKTALIKNEKPQAQKIKKAFPKLTLDHLVRERYPAFIDAIRDLDDALSLIFLFACLPMKIIASHTEEIATKTNRIANEWMLFIATSHSLRKVFVSIKGIYFQANILGQQVTWLVPHKFCQYTPTDVDYRVMLTFLSFYLTLTRFVQFKLYYDQGWKYPPLLDDSKDSQRLGLRAWAIERRTNDSPNGSAAPLTATADAMVLSTANAVNGEEDRVELDDFSKLNGGKEEKMDEEDDANKEAQQIRKALDEEKEVNSVFRSLFFYLSRETPQEALEFVIRCGGGECLCESATEITAQQLSQVTHFIIDRPSLSQCSSTVQAAVASKAAVQPQWVFDSFNMRVPLPTFPYTVGVAPPPHISPFVDDEKEGYKPKQRAVLEQWAAASRGKLLSAKTDEQHENEEQEDGNEDADNEDEDDDEQDEGRMVESKEEAQFQRGIQRELRALQTAEKSVDEEDDDDDENLPDDGEVQKEEDDADSSDEEQLNTHAAKASAEEEEEEEAGAVEESEPKVWKKTARAAAKEQKASAKASAEKELAMTLMSRKDARLYSRIQYGINKKKEAAETLHKKRKAIENEQSKPQKTGRKSSSSSSSSNSSSLSATPRGAAKKRKVTKKSQRADADDDDSMH